jgi:hypothetical protein
MLSAQKREIGAGNLSSKEQHVGLDRTGVFVLREVVNAAKIEVLLFQVGDDIRCKGLALVKANK